jgi:hypothetical protein
MKYQDLVNEQGFLTKEGQAFVDEKIGFGIDEFLETATSEIQMRILGSVLAKYIGDMVASKLTSQKQTVFDKMNDDEFEAHMKSKYGEDWMLQTATSEELKRCVSLAKEKMQFALEEGMKARERALKAQGTSNSLYDLRFK